VFLKWDKKEARVNYKPGSVLGNHSSDTFVTECL